MPRASSCAKALPPTTTAANNTMPRAKPANRAVFCTVFPLRDLLRAAAVAAAVITSQDVVSVEPKAKRSASSRLNISWVQRIGGLHLAQGGASRDGDHAGRRLRRRTP